MNIRLATVQDMDAILAIYAYARTQMKNTIRTSGATTTRQWHCC